ncbi:hypothetical protein [Actinopolymorpha pittospori]|uniref:Lipopolysaccharide assembly protein A domain-containing protein n=1 Tax=Actinopolymorpha pittospori TaxID=648752 RepID=A0A927MW66_9ACTN|nr:hypothetical protein [Actinopolymorpha pittospori]MBE1606398.1 hypothetical protein [Actinopolymorpha pittospori]
MIVVGVVLLLVMIAAAVGAGVGGGQTTAVVLGPLRIESTTSTFFFIGVVVALGAAAGVWCLLVGTKHWRARKQELKELRQRSVQPAPVGADDPALPQGESHPESRPGLEERPSTAPASAEDADPGRAPRRREEAGPASDPGERGAPPRPEGQRPGQEPMP